MENKNRETESKKGFSLRPKARILKTLGEELISSETVAIIELVKNSYDADATNVLIEFSGEIEEGKGCISIYDDGHGMGLDVIKNSWMTIATSNKKVNKKSKNGSRRVLGEKGIGRFATSRISGELELYSRKPNDTQEVYTFFDWTQFENDDLYLDEILFLSEVRNAIEVTAKSPIRKLPTSLQNDISGTSLKMNILKHSWEKKDFYDLERGLSRLVSPFNPINNFNIYIKGVDGYLNKPFKVEAPGIVKYPHYKIFGNVGADGEYSFEVKVESQGENILHNGFFNRKNIKGDWEVQSSLIPPEKFVENELKSIECGALSFELLVWDRDDLGNVVQELGGGIRSVRNDLDSIAGINIYRDGFRVLPYGEPNNDWLRLDIRRVQTPTKRLSNNQITGYISISADGNPALHDRSNREGLDNNVAYSDLTQIMQCVLTDFESIRYAARRPNKKTGGDSKPQPGLFDKPDLSAVKDLVKKGSANTSVALELITKAESDWSSQIKKFQDVLAKYHSLATLGGVVDKVLHDGRQPLASIQVEAGLGRELAEDIIELKGEVDIESIAHIESGFAKIISQASILNDVFKRVEPFGGRKKGRPKKYYIESLISDNFDIYRNEIDSEGISVILPKTKNLVSTDITEMSEVFTNLITNSIYWLGKVERKNRKIAVQVGRVDGGGLEIVFSDSGPGVDDSIRSSIFEPYVSNRTDGHGLGLCLVGEILKEYYDGSVELLDTGSVGGAAFRLVMKRRV